MPFTKMTPGAEDFCVVNPSLRPTIPRSPPSGPAFVTMRYMSSTRLRIITEPSVRSADTRIDGSRIGEILAAKSLPVLAWPPSTPSWASTSRPGRRLRTNRPWYSSNRRTWVWHGYRIQVVPQTHTSLIEMKFVDIDLDDSNAKGRRCRN